VWWEVHFKQNIEKAKLEGKDALDVVDDKNSLFRPLPGISDEDEEKSGSKMAKVLFVYKTIWMNLMVWTQNWSIAFHNN
jgi:hypothetical protein